ncbi:protein shisa-like-2A [Cyprinodon tularosa]|uniref:membrane protein FAM159A n=1 Tax=Cyprinodon variegatus TaxID=28743 RepID=UPI000742A26E|nr:PREDICTED: membrane protein FAM159A [Cyprinodon variegatus]XP_038147559.1 protein shisa-like-2A [Cyprinodon tularosa]
MSALCESYYSREKVFVESFACPKAGGDSTAVFCCGFSDLKYCCDDPNSFFPYEYGYMWWLSLGALVGLSVAAVVLLAFIITLCVLCYLFVTTKPRGLDSGLPLRAPDVLVSQQGAGTSHSSAPSGPQGLRKHFVRGKLDCDNQQPDPDRLFQRCFMATVTSINVENPA